MSAGPEVPTGSDGLRVNPDLLERSDAELLAASRTGDQDAYGELFRRHMPAATALARRLTGHPSDADDLVSEAFTKVLAALKNGNGPTSALRPYLLTAVRRVHVDRAVAAQRVQPTDDMGAHDPGVPFVDSALIGLERSMVAQAYRQLPERWQMVLWHTEVEELSPKDIAPLLGMSPNAVAALALRARAGLREAYLAAHVTTTASPECERMLPKLAAYVRGSAAAREAAAVERHLPDCADCRAVLAELKDIGGRMRAVIAPLILGVAATGYLADIAALPSIAAPTIATAAAGAGAGATVTGAGTVTSAGGGAAGGSGGAAGGGAAGGGGAGAGGAAAAAGGQLAGWLVGAAATVIVAGAVAGAVTLGQNNARQSPGANQEGSVGAGAAPQGNTQAPPGEDPSHPPAPAGPSAANTSDALPTVPLSGAIAQPTATPAETSPAPTETARPTTLPPVEPSFTTPPLVEPTSPPTATPTTTTPPPPTTTPPTTTTTPPETTPPIEPTTPPTDTTTTEPTDTPTTPEPTDTEPTDPPTTPEPTETPAAPAASVQPQAPLVGGAGRAGYLLVSAPSSEHVLDVTVTMSVGMTPDPTGLPSDCTIGVTLAGEFQVTCTGVQDRELSIPVIAPVLVPTDFTVTSVVSGPTVTPSTTITTVPVRPLSLAPLAAVSVDRELTGSADGGSTSELSVTVPSSDTPLEVTVSLPAGLKVVQEGLPADCSAAPAGTATEVACAGAQGRVLTLPVTADAVTTATQYTVTTTVSGAGVSPSTSTSTVTVQPPIDNGTPMLGRYTTTGPVTSVITGGSFEGTGRTSVASSATLTIPGPTIRYARLYWAGQTTGGPDQNSMLLTGPDGTAHRITAGTTDQLTGTAAGWVPSFSSSADVTAIVQAGIAGAGSTTWTGAAATPFDVGRDADFAGWTLVVVADLPAAADGSLPASSVLTISDGSVALAARNSFNSYAYATGGATSARVVTWGGRSGHWAWLRLGDRLSLLQVRGALAENLDVLQVDSGSAGRTLTVSTVGSERLMISAVVTQRPAG